MTIKETYSLMAAITVLIFGYWLSKTVKEEPNKFD
jgi:hypothetical protein